MEGRLVGSGFALCCTNRRLIMLARLDALAGLGVLVLARPNPIPGDLDDATGRSVRSTIPAVGFAAEDCSAGSHQSDEITPKQGGTRWVL